MRWNVMERKDTGRKEGERRRTDSKRSHGGSLSVNLASRQVSLVSSGGIEGQEDKTNLINVCHSLGQKVWSNLITIFIPKLSSFTLRSLNLRSSVRMSAGHDATNCRSDVEDVGDRVWIQQLVWHFLLSDDD